MSEFIRVQDRDGVRLIAFARPEKKNAITSEMYARIVSALREAQANPELKVVLFTGLGDSFTAGNDVADFLNQPPAGESAPVFQLLHLLVDFPKPIVAAVPGLAIGIGTTLLLHCDLVYASENAKFKMPFIDLGLVPEAGSSQIVPQLLGHVRAAELLLLGDAIDAETACRYGIVNQVLPAAELLAHAKAKAAALAAKPLEALLASKALMKRAPEALHTRIDVEAKHFVERLASAEAKAIFASFLSKK
jgi:enoyl-CoA hydratase/carnithine racemase